jgi:hypothetical protein
VWGWGQSVSRNIAGICKYLCVCHQFAEDLGNNILCVEMLPEILEISGVFRTIQKKIASMYGNLLHCFQADCRFCAAKNCDSQATILKLFGFPSFRFIPETRRV